MVHRQSTLMKLALGGLLGIVLARGQDSDDESGKYHALRAELKTLSATPGDFEFWSAYSGHLAEQGLALPAWQGEYLSLGPSSLLQSGDETGTDWRFHWERGVVEIPKGIFVRFVTDQGLTEQPPDPQHLANATILIGTGPESLTIVHVDTGLVTVIR